MVGGLLGDGFIAASLMLTNGTLLEALKLT
jgi:hypothetical protein